MSPVAIAPRIPGILAADLADDCRFAVHTFCRGVAAGWGKRELAAWLAGPYAAVAHLVDEAAMPAATSFRPPATPDDAIRDAALANARIARLLSGASRGSSSCVEACITGREHRYLEEAAEWGTLATVVDEDGVTCVAPVHRTGLSLRLRVRSLVLADFLMRADDYRGALQPCVLCGVALLGARDRRRGQCADHRRPSDIYELGAPVLLDEVVASRR